MVAVEEIEIAFRQIAGADIILILIPFDELFLDFGICPFFKVGLFEGADASFSFSLIALVSLSLDEPALMVTSVPGAAL